MKNLVIAIIVIILIIIGIVYYVNQDSGDVIDGVDTTEMVGDETGEDTFMTDEDKAMMDTSAEADADGAMIEGSIEVTQ